MKFPTPLISGRLVKRYKRFLADVQLDDGAIVTAHTPNTGSMKTCSEPGCRVWLSPADKPGRKLKFTWELSSDDETIVGVHTGHPNRLVEEAIGDGYVPSLSGYDDIRREVKYGERSRIDLLLTRGEERCYVEVKNVTLCEDRIAWFPDAVTARGRKHLIEMTAMVAQGHRAAMAYVVQRMDGDIVQPAAHIDPAYAKALAEAMDAGVEAVGLRFDPTPQAITFDALIPVELPDKSG